MRHPDYFTDKGFHWSFGAGPKSSGVRVLHRYQQAGYWQANPNMPSIDELAAFTQPRFPTLSVNVVGPSKTEGLLRSTFAKGTFFRMRKKTCDAKKGKRYWHGLNMYVVKSVVDKGLRNYLPNHGPSGVYCFADVRAYKTASYCYYVLSGTGCAWTVVAELAIDPSHVKKYAHDQYVADETNVTLVALWFHGVSQNEFTNEWIWPVWNPSLEVPS